MSDQSATDFGRELFADFSVDPFFAPAFKTLSWTETTQSGDILSGGSTSTTNYSGLAAEIGGAVKARMVQDIDGITMTDVYVKASFADFAEVPKLSQQVTYDGETMTVVERQADPVKATFDLFLRR